MQQSARPVQGGYMPFLRHGKLLPLGCHVVWNLMFLQCEDLDFTNCMSVSALLVLVVVHTAAGFFLSSGVYSVPLDVLKDIFDRLHMFGNRSCVSRNVCGC